MKLSDKAVKEIADNLSCGLICYVHVETKEIKSLMDPDSHFIDETLWKYDVDEIEKNADKYLMIDKMSSQQSFRVMADFVDEVVDLTIQKRLINALNRKKPFSNFKYEVDGNEEVRQQWFKFRDSRYIEWVRMQLGQDDDDYDEPRAPIINGFYNDDGTEFKPGLHPLPDLCMSCTKKDDPNEELLCNLNRMDQLGGNDFKCGAYDRVENS